MSKLSDNLKAAASFIEQYPEADVFATVTDEKISIRGYSGSSPIRKPAYMALAESLRTAPWKRVATGTGVAWTCQTGLALTGARLEIELPSMEDYETKPTDLGPVSFQKREKTADEADLASGLLKQ